MFDVIDTERFPGLTLQYHASPILTESQAFEVSIAKWEQLYDLCNQGKLVDDGGIQTCGLCALYFYGHMDECEGCPIKNAGHMGCIGTPYKDYLAALKNGNLELAKQAAKEEIQFLRSF